MLVLWAQWMVVVVVVVLTWVVVAVYQAVGAAKSRAKFQAVHTKISVVYKFMDTATTTVDVKRNRAFQLVAPVRLGLNFM